MKNLHLYALTIGAFLFSLPSESEELPDSSLCPVGSDYQLLYGSQPACTVPAAKYDGWELTVRSDYPPYSGFKAMGKTKEDALAILLSHVSADLRADPKYQPSTTPVGGYQCNFVTSNFNFEDILRSSLDGIQVIIKRDRVGVPTTEHGYCPGISNETQRSVGGNTSLVTWVNKGGYECPPDNPPDVGFVNFYESGETRLCYKLAEPKPPCDCTDLAGESGLPYSSFLALNTAYTGSNQPECLNVSDPDTGQSCDCQFVAKKWLQFNAGSTHTRWEPYPTENGGITGTYTGAACNADASDVAPPPEEKEECFKLKSGVSWCWADPKEKCTVVNGQEQCDSGCGYINGDFVCYEDDKPPVIPPEQQDKNPVDDDITDPNKSMADMVKGDFKDVNSGIEQRLDNIGISTDNNNATLQAIEGEAKETNAKLDGIGKQLDGQGKTLKGIEKGIGDAFGDEGSPDGACKGECTGSWYESVYPDGMVGIWQEHSAALQQTPMFDFLNQFQLAPNGQQPDLNLCFNLGAMGDYGCHSLEIPSVIWPFIKIVILISAAFLCRALIFGG